jgi:hypothetical protein
MIIQCNFVSVSVEQNVLIFSVFSTITIIMTMDDDDDYYYY